MLDDEAVAASRILVVDDDPGIRDMLGSALGYAGFDVHIAGDVPEAMRWLSSSRADAIVLDVMLPGGSGFDVLQLLRGRDDRVPVLFLSARDAVEDRIRGLHLGGDDYVTKPFSVAEVSARLTALIRRARSGAAEDEPDAAVLRCADLELDTLRHEVRRGGAPVALSPTEFRLLQYLLVNQGHVMSRSQILEEIWMYDFGGTSQVVERFVSNLRRKIDDGHEPLIQTVRGVGYSLRRGAR
jgi:two-component system OmpR family response regulator